MNDQMQKELLGRLDALSAKLGVAGQALWQMYVRQARIDAWECVLACVIFMVTFYICAKAARSDFRKERSPYDDPIAAAVWTFGAIASVAIVLICLFCGIDLFANPQLCAFANIMSALKR